MLCRSSPYRLTSRAPHRRSRRHLRGLNRLWRRRLTRRRGRRRSRIDRDKEALEEVRGVLKNAGFYAYGRLDDQSRWCISVDDEMGRADVRIGDDGYEIELTSSSPGLYADEESDWRRASRARRP